MKIAVIGLGYVGLPIAIAFGNEYETYGFDINTKKIEKYKSGYDVTNEVGNEELKKSKIKFTDDPKYIKNADFVIIAVPTPVGNDNKPDLYCLLNATKIVAQNLKVGSTVIYESTVYPGTTEEICIPIIEINSGLKFNKEFYVGYSPERINPGDKEHKFSDIVKLVSGSNQITTDKISNLYKKCLKNKIVKVSSIKVAEASKIIENTQRDVNIAFMNEICKIFHKMGLDTSEVLQAANTKWNFLDFKPGLVGGHCIGVDPYYLAYKAKEINSQAELILTSRRINDTMSLYVAECLERELLESGIKLEKANVLIKGLTFKENISDIRNSKIIDVVNKLKEDKVNVFLEDYWVDSEELKKMYNLSLSKKIEKVDAVVIAVGHNDYYKIELIELEKLYRNNNKILFDLQGIFDKNELLKRGFKLWRL